MTTSKSSVAHNYIKKRKYKKVENKVKPMLIIYDKLKVKT